MDGIREDELAPKETPNANYKIRALDDAGKSCVIPYGSFSIEPNEDDIRDFWENGKIVKKRYSSGTWIEVGLEWEL